MSCVATDWQDETSSLSIRVVDTRPLRSRLQVSGEIDIATVGQLAAALRHERARRRFVRVDLSGVRFCDASGIDALADAHQQLLADGGRLILTGTTPRLNRLLQICGLDRVLFIDRGSSRRATDPER